VNKVLVKLQGKEWKEMRLHIVQVEFVPENNAAREVCAGLNPSNFLSLLGADITPPCSINLLVTNDL